MVTITTNLLIQRSAHCSFFKENLSASLYLLMQLILNLITTRLLVGKLSYFYGRNFNTFDYSLKRFASSEKLGGSELCLQMVCLNQFISIIFSGFIMISVWMTGKLHSSNSDVAYQLINQLVQQSKLLIKNQPHLTS